MSIDPKDIHDKYFSTTPVFWRKVGDTILIFGTTMTATFAGMEIGKEWIITMSLITAFGKMVTNFFKDE
ncbi:MAG TPA: hypothetical protein PK059_02135 [Cyclobacteriaceae bacterium]|nr:hypothetical protein [Cyclobacteriaceae bacterium]